MKLNLKCIPCYVNQVLQAADLLGVDEDTKIKMTRESLEAISKFKMGEHAFHTFNLAQDVVRKYEPKKDPYRKLKKKYNQICLHLEPKVRKMIADSEDQFETALRIAVAGNIIDFVQHPEIDESLVEKTIQKALVQPLNDKRIRLLKEEVDKAENILYVGDNTGEIVFDKVFIEQIGPQKVTFVVRGGPTINDATLEDAEEVGLTKLVKVITTGIDLPGAMLDLASDQFRKNFNQADLIIAKGQGNYEALNEEQKEIFFLLKVKCSVISESMSNKYKVGDIVADTFR